MKIRTIKFTVFFLSIFILGSIVGGYIVYRTYSQLAVPAVLGAAALNASINARLVKLIHEKKIKSEQFNNVLCISVNDWPSFHAEFKSYIENGILPESYIKKIPAMKEALINIESANKIISSNSKYCEPFK